MGLFDGDFNIGGSIGGGLLGGPLGFLGGFGPGAGAVGGGVGGYAGAYLGQKLDPKTGQPLPDQPGGYPPYASAYDPNSMSLTNRMQEVDAANSKGYNAFRDEATRQGPSGWSQQAKLAADLKEKDSRDRAAFESAGQSAKARSDLASQGGLSSGARERIAEGGAQNHMNMSQGITRQGQLDDMNVSMQDQSNKLSALSQLPGIEQNKISAWEQARQGDINNQMAETERMNKYNMDIYNAKMQQWAANRQAQATENSGKK